MHQSRVLSRRVHPAGSEYETTPIHTLRFRVAAYWMRTSTSNLLSLVAPWSRTAIMPRPMASPPFLRCPPELEFLLARVLLYPPGPDSRECVIRL